MALGAIRAAVERGLDVPGDVSVIGYDDTILMEFVDPPLTTIRQPVRAISQTVVQVLVERIAGSPVRRREYLFRPEPRRARLHRSGPVRRRRAPRPPLTHPGSRRRPRDGRPRGGEPSGQITSR